MRTIETQSQEFEAVSNLCSKHRRLMGTAVVDDDYPEMRRDYETALVTLLEKMKENDRFITGNRYGLYTT